MSPSPSSTGSPKTTAAGILSVVLGILGLLGQIAGAFQGRQIDQNVALGSATAIVSGAGLVVAKDHQ